ncbi:hypothetical protein GCM10029964_078480 [Kibdelosporangium lantanae]
MGDQLTFRILGPTSVHVGDRAIRIGGARNRVVLVLLLLHAGRVVPTDVLVEALWNGNPPATARTQVAICVAALRKAFRCAGDGVIRTEHPGYQLDIDGHRLDLHDFDHLVAAAEQAVREGEWRAAAKLYDEAMSLWVEPALAGIRSSIVEREAERLEERRLAVFDEAAAVRLELGGWQDLIPELTAVVRTHPLRERSRWQLMLAQYRSGRRADALATFRAGRREFITELGLEPGHELQELHAAILRSDPGVVVEQPPDATLVPAEVPPDLSCFSGRAAETATLDNALLAARDGETTLRVGVLTGSAGVGKTGLAVHWAHHAADHFPDGMLFADMTGYAENARPASTSTTLSRFLRALGVPGGQIPDGMDSRVSLYRSLLARRRVLIVLDNVNACVDVEPLLPPNGQSCVLVTSRDAVEHVVASPPSGRVRLGTLAESEATELLAKVAGHSRVTAEPRDTLRVTELCARLPLALRIAAARLAAKDHWTVGHLAARLSDPDQRLDELSQGDAQLRTGFATSYHTLDTHAARLYRLLGLLDVPDFPVWIAAALLDTTPSTAEQLLERLVEAHFLEVRGVDATGGLRYGFHDLLRLYAWERAREEDPPADRWTACKRVFHACQTMARQASHGGATGPERTPRAADWLAAERFCLTAIVGQAARMGLRDVADELTAVSGVLAEAG